MSNRPHIRQYTSKSPQYCYCCTDIKNPDGGKPKSTFEVEVEVIDPPALLEDSQFRPDLFDKKLMCCLDTARILMRNV